MYRYDRNDYDCEVFRYARARAAALYRFFKASYCGDVEDLAQAAMIAAVEVGDAAVDKQQVPFEPLKKAVDRAVRAEAGAFSRQDANTDDAEEKLRVDGKRTEPARKSTETGDEKAAAAKTFRIALVLAIGEDRYQRLLDYYVEFGGGRDAAAKIARKHNSVTKPKHHISADYVLKQIEDDTRLLSTKIREKTLRPLVEARDPLP